MVCREKRGKHAKSWFDFYQLNSSTLLLPPSLYPVAIFWPYFFLLHHFILLSLLFNFKYYGHKVVQASVCGRPLYPRPHTVTAGR